ncbi:hypothetical protein C8Q70DRAFT_955394 [Cubamyces menziesii]|nr:hypothetical protein C8Q70DRAFT_955394 [Cubamyces menziesii]
METAEVKDEKQLETVIVSDVESSEIDFRDKDEALRLVGLEKAATFTEGEYTRVRRKLDLVIPPLCAAVYCTQYLDKTALSYARYGANAAW